MRRALAVTSALLTVSGVIAGCGTMADDDSMADADAPAVTAVADVPPAAAYSVAPVADAPHAEVSLVDQARAIIRPTCGTCHTASSPQANAKALAIYDLERPDWGATMSRAQLESFGKRVAGKPEWAGEPKATLDAYVEELRARAGPGS